MTKINSYFNYVKYYLNLNPKILLSGIISNLSIAVLEEFIFRIFLFISLIQFIPNKKLLIITTSMMFSLYHFPSDGILFLSYLLGGIMYGYAFIKFHSILVPIGLHFSWNFVQGSLFGFPVSGQASEGILVLEIIPNVIYNGGSFGPEGSMLGILIRIAIIFSIYLLPTPKNKCDFLNLPKNMPLTS
jgi:membrane protease YdiL (CAAX protease family)